MQKQYTPPKYAKASEAISKVADAIKDSKMLKAIYKKDGPTGSDLTIESTYHHLTDQEAIAYSFLRKPLESIFSNEAQEAFSRRKLNEMGWIGSVLFEKTAKDCGYTIAFKYDTSEAISYIMFETKSIDRVSFDVEDMTSEELEYIETQGYSIPPWMSIIDNPAILMIRLGDDELSPIYGSKESVKALLDAISANIKRIGMSCEADSAIMDLLI